MPDELSDEDQKLVTLARGAAGRVRARQGAAVRDETGRSYSAATVSLASLRLSALQLAVAQAVAAGARGLECAVIIDRDRADEPAPDLAGAAAVAEVGGADVPLLLCGPDGSVVARTSAGVPVSGPA